MLHESKNKRSIQSYLIHNDRSCRWSKQNQLENQQVVLTGNLPLVLNSATCFRSSSTDTLGTTNCRTYHTHDHHYLGYLQQYNKSHTWPLPSWLSPDTEQITHVTITSLLPPAAKQMTHDLTILVTISCKTSHTTITSLFTFNCRINHTLPSLAWLPPTADHTHDHH